MAESMLSQGMFDCHLLPAPLFRDYNGQDLTLPLPFAIVTLFNTHENVQTSSKSPRTTVRHQRRILMTL
eukprot:5057198-Amphidinium_carterae.1